MICFTFIVAREHRLAAIDISQRALEYLPLAVIHEPREIATGCIAATNWLYDSKVSHKINVQINTVYWCYSYRS